MTTAVKLTADLTNGFVNVNVPSGVGVSELLRGGIVTIPSTGDVNAVSQITGNTTLDLVSPYTGPTATGVEVIVTLVPGQSYRALVAQRQLTDHIAEFLVQFKAASNSYAFTYDSQTTVASPGEGGFRFNQANPADATIITVSRETIDGLDESDMIMADVTGGDTAIQVNAEAFKFRADITSTVDNGGWIQFNLENVTVTGEIETGKHVAVSLNRRGLQGLTGPQPDAGAFTVVSETDFPSETITVLCTGQSNGLGRNSGGREAFSSLLSIWNNENDINSATINLGDQFRSVNLGVRPFVNGAQSPLVQACNLLARAIGKNVRIVFVAMGGRRIDSWSDEFGNRGSMYNRIQQVMDEASVTAFDAILYHQGESDDNAGVTNVYQASWNGFVANMMTDGWITATTPIVTGYCPKEFVDVNAVHTAIAAADSRVEVAATAGFATELVTASSTPHYIGEEAMNIGMEYVRALNRIPNTPFTGILDGADLDGVDVVLADANNDFKRTSIVDATDGRRKDTMQALKLVDQSNIPDATYVKVDFPVVSWKHGYDYDASLSRLTPREGVHDLYATTHMSGLATGGAVLLLIYKNGVEWARVQDRCNGNSQALSVQKTDYCDGLSFYEVYAYLSTQNDAATGKISGVSSETWFGADQK